MQGEVRCEQPNASLYTFTGNLMLSPPVVEEGQTVPLSQASLLLRGSSLRNTKYVLGTVIFAGHESKVSPAHNTSRHCPSSQCMYMCVVKSYLVAALMQTLIGFGWHAHCRRLSPATGLVWLKQVIGSVW